MGNNEINENLFEDLISADNSKQRIQSVNQIAPQELLRRQVESVRLLNDGYCELVQSLLAKAQITVNQYIFSVRVLNKEQDGSANRCYYYPRVVVLNGSSLTFSIEWARVFFITNPKNKKVFTRSKRLKKNKTEGYRLTEFINTPEWSKELIRETELEFRKIRSDYEELKKMKRCLSSLIDSLNKTIENHNSKHTEDCLCPYDFKSPNSKKINV